MTTLWLGAHYIGDQHPTHAWYDIVAYTAWFAFLILWLLSTDSVSDRLPAMSLQRQGTSRALVLSPPQKPLRSRRSLSARAADFSRAVLEFLAEWDRTNPMRRMGWSYSETKTDEERRTEFEQESKDMVQHMSEQMNEYYVRFLSTGIALFIPNGCTHSCPTFVTPWQQPPITWHLPLALPDPENPRCDCGHPKSAHDDESGCHATIYENVPNGMNAWPCRCGHFKACRSSHTVPLRHARVIPTPGSNG